MASGYRSRVFWWFTGYNSGGAGPVVLCPCPEYKVDATLSNTFTKEASLPNQFSKEQTLSNQWKRGGCNG
jgi:hypothetical protein